MMKSLLFVYNPNSGKALIKNKIADILDIFVKAGYMPIAYPTQSYQDAHRIIKEYQGAYDLLVCSGGDGTLDEVVTAVMESGKKVPVGYIPAGSTNDFARSLRISQDMLKAAYMAVNGEVFPCDIGEFNGDTFVYVAAFGMFTDVSYETSQGVKNVLGQMAYVLEGMKRIYNIPSYNMKFTYGDQVHEGNYLFGMITNTRSVGGFKNIVRQDVVFDDGEFEVTLIRRPDNILELQEIIASLLIEQIDSKYMTSFKTDKLIIECKEDVAWTLDGEFGGEHTYVEINNLNKALDIVVNPKHKKSFMKE